LDWRAVFPLGETRRFYGSRGRPPLQTRGKNLRRSGAPLGVLGALAVHSDCRVPTQCHFLSPLDFGGVFDAVLTA